MEDAAGDELTAVVVRRDAQRDLALLQTAPHGLPVARVATSAPEVGEDAYVIGGSNWSLPVTRGEVTGVLDECRDGVLDVQTTAAMDGGDSGGPLVDSSGTVLGINKSGFDDGSASATSYAEVREFLALPESAFDQDGYLVRPEDRDDGYCEYVE